MRWHVGRPISVSRFGDDEECVKTDQESIQRGQLAMMVITASVPFLSADQPDCWVAVGQEPDVVIGSRQATREPAFNSSILPGPDQQQIKRESAPSYRVPGSSHAGAGGSESEGARAPRDVNIIGGTCSIT